MAMTHSLSSEDEDFVLSIMADDSMNNEETGPPGNLEHIIALILPFDCCSDRYGP